MATNDVLGILGQSNIKSLEPLLWAEKQPNGSIREVLFLSFPLPHSLSQERQNKWKLICIKYLSRQTCPLRDDCIEISHPGWKPIRVERTKLCVFQNEHSVLINRIFLCVHACILALRRCFCHSHCCDSCSHLGPHVKRLPWISYRELVCAQTRKLSFTQKKRGASCTKVAYAQKRDIRLFPHWCSDV